jgi:hypothetical protein
LCRIVTKINNESARPCRPLNLACSRRGQQALGARGVSGSRDPKHIIIGVVGQSGLAALQQPQVLAAGATDSSLVCLA